MALINRETDYAIRILRSLNGTGGKTVSDICKDQEFTKPFAYKIIKKLEKAGIVGIARGKQGGIFLNTSLDKISLYDLMNAVDNPQYVNECFKPGYKCEFSDKSLCGVHDNLSRLQKSIDRELKECLLSKLV